MVHWLSPHMLQALQLFSLNTGDISANESNVEDLVRREVGSSNKSTVIGVKCHATRDVDREDADVPTLETLESIPHWFRPRRPSALVESGPRKQREQRATGL